MKKTINPLNKRLILLNDLERLILESVYYRAYGKETNSAQKYVIWNYSQKSNKVMLK